MLTINKVKYINSLKQKKFRDQNHVFIAEGVKLVREILNSDFVIKSLICNNEGFKLFSTKVKSETEILQVKDKELDRFSLLKNSQKVLAIVEKKNNTLKISQLNKKLSLFLDDIKDPGNLGTIIRIADWYGIENVICSMESVDNYNPKVIQASMGAIVGVNVFYTNKINFFKEIKEKTDLEIYGTFLEGENIYKQKLAKKGIIVMGSEANGISTEVETFVSKKLLIPSFSADMHGVESLNVAVASAIICSEFKRLMIDD